MKCYTPIFVFRRDTYAVSGIGGRENFMTGLYVVTQEDINVNIHIMKTHIDDRLYAADRKALPDSAYGLPERREYPMPDAAHVRAAEAYFRYCPEELKPVLARAILNKAKEFGVDVESPTVKKYAGE